MKKLGKISSVFFMAFILIFGYIKAVQAEENADYSKNNDIVVVLDVSGSMASTDADRLSFETIEVLTNLCDKEDRIGFVAFNERIVYQSELVQIKDEQSILNMLDSLQKVKYHGDTDNGLGLITGLELLCNDKTNRRNQIMIFISDGKIDLPNPVNGRTEHQSQNDMEKSVNIAIERKIPIFTFGFTEAEPEISDELTAISTATHATNYICSGPLQMMNNILNVIMLYKKENLNSQITVRCDEKLQKYDVKLDENRKTCIVLQASDEIVDFEVISSSDKYTITSTRHCRIVNFVEGQSEKITLCYRIQKAGSVIINDTRFEIQNEEKICIPQIQINVASTPKCEENWGEFNVKKELNKGLILAFIGLIVITIIICIGIFCAFFYKRKKHVYYPNVLKGFLDICFIDLKSKNDIPAMVWDLKKYPPEGVTLKELFAGSGVQEDLPQLEQICLYPEDSGDGLILVHCTDGGIFVDDKTVSKNVPAHVHYGETIYVAFAENASEISLKYLEKKEENQQCM